MKSILLGLTLLCATATGAVYYSAHRGNDSAPTYRTAKIVYGDISSSIGATGTIEPEEVVDVGAQVAGLILEFGTDPHNPKKLIDYGSTVEKGTILAKIDATPYEASLDQAEASLEQSKANLLQYEAKYEQAEQDWKRAENLRAHNANAVSDYDSAVANMKTAKANVAVGKANIRACEASLRMAKTNLGYTTITSPVQGFIIDRRVNIGQTVVASLNAPSLFLIAKDLMRMQVWASVNEADIGSISVGMPARFTVDAYHGRSFAGIVSQIRMNATMTQNVVTYTVVVSADNADGKLLPYLTANVQFDVGKRQRLLLVPSTALRWKPQSSQIDPSMDLKRPASAEPGDSQEHGTLWTVAENNLVRPVDVVVGANDATMTEVSGAGVKEGLQIVFGDSGQQEDAGEDSAEKDKASNPFLPKLPKGAKPPPGPM
jgi:HlyD family secretion protein